MNAGAATVGDAAGIAHIKSMSEMPDAGQHHGHAVFVAGGDGILTCIEPPG